MRLRTAACGAPNCAIRSVGASGGRGVDDDRDTFWFRDRRLFAAFLGLHHARPSRTGTCVRAPEEKHALMGLRRVHTLGTTRANKLARSPAPTTLMFG